MQKTTLALAGGDLLTLAVVTLVGFATHGEARLALLPRMLTTFIPLTMSWLLFAALLKLFDPEISANPRQLWRLAAAMFFAGPLAELLRALLLGTIVIPVFGVVLSASAALGLLIWRAVWIMLRRSKSA